MSPSIQTGNESATIFLIASHCKTKFWPFQQAVLLLKLAKISLMYGGQAIALICFFFQNYTEGEGGEGNCEFIKMTYTNRKNFGIKNEC